MAHSEASDGEGGLDLFDEPEGFRPKTPPPTTASYTLRRLEQDDRGNTAQSTQLISDEEIILDLVGSHPLWGHHLWNAAPTLSDFLAGVAAESLEDVSADQDEKRASSWCKGANVLELGAAAGLPSIVAAMLGAKRVIATDYPDPGLINNLAKNMNRALERARKSEREAVGKGKEACAWAQGYIWGHDAAPLLSNLDEGDDRFDLLLLSDLIFNHQAHPALLQTMDACLPQAQTFGTSHPPGREKERNTPCALVFFSHHRPHLAERDMDFFTQAEAAGWKCESVGQWKMLVCLLPFLEYTFVCYPPDSFPNSPCSPRMQEARKSEGQYMGGESGDDTEIQIVHWRKASSRVMTKG